MNSDERLKLSPLHLGQIFDGDVNQGVEKEQEVLIGLFHDVAVSTSIVQCLLCITSPDHLYTKKTNLKTHRSEEWSVYQEKPQKAV